MCRMWLRLVLTKYLVLVFISDPAGIPNKPCHEEIRLICGV